jgi:hypothetical protein
MKQEDIKHSTGKINKKELEADLSIAAAKQYSARVRMLSYSIITKRVLILALG